MTKTVNDADFQSQVLDSSELTLVDFWAEWCGPCKVLGPTIDQLATEYAGKVSVAKVNVDENPKTPARYGIRGIPTVLVFRRGELVDQIVGAVPKEVLVDSIRRNI